MRSQVFARGVVRTIDELRSRFALRGATRVGAGVRIFGALRVANEGELVVGNRVSFVASPAAIDLVVARGASLVIEDRALIESGAVVRAGGRVRIGAAARIGAACIIDDEGTEAGEVSVGAGAWVEDGAVLLAGTQVPDGGVLARASESKRNGHEAANGGGPRSRRADAIDVDRADVDRRLRATLSRILPGASQVDHATNLGDVKGWDSLAALRTLVALEKEFGILLPYQLFAQHSSLESVTPVIMAGISRRLDSR